MGKVETSVVDLEVLPQTLESWKPLASGETNSRLRVLFGEIHPEIATNDHRNLDTREQCVF